MTQPQPTLSKALRIRRAAEAALKQAGVQQVYADAVRTSAAAEHAGVRLRLAQETARFDMPRSQHEEQARWLTLEVHIPASAGMDGDEVIPAEVVADPVVSAVKAALRGNDFGRLAISTHIERVTWEAAEVDGEIDPDELDVCVSVRVQYQDD